MGQVLQFPQAKVQDKRPMPAPADVRPMALRQGQRASTEPILLQVKPEELGAGGAAMQVLAALTFYAKNGWDEGKRARGALIAMHEAAEPGPQLA